MTTVTISKGLTKKRDLVMISRREYEEFLKFRLRKVSEVKMTAAQKQALNRARKNLARGKYLTIHDLKQKLGITN